MRSSARPDPFSISIIRRCANAVRIYVQVPDLQAALAKAEGMGAKVVMPITEIPGAVTMALFADPDGNVVGLVKG